MKNNSKLKNVFILIISIFVLVSCQQEENNINQTNTDDINYETYIVWWNSLKSRVLEWNIVSNNSLKKISSIAWKISELNCNAWTKVKKDTLIATITPDFTDPNIKWLVNTKNSLSLQLLNLEWIKLSTINNIDSQISTLNSSIVSAKEQLELTKKNYDLLIKQKSLTSSDISTQIETLEEQEKNLIKQKDLIEKSKNQDLKKLNSSIENIKITSYSTISDILLYIDELYWITSENKNKNDKFENLLAAKETSIKNDVKVLFDKLNNTDYKKLTWEELSVFENELNDLVKLSYTWVKKSVPSVGSLDEVSITTYYNTLLWYSNWLITIKTNLDSIVENNSTIENTYDNQIAALNTNIDSLKWNINNLKNNKSESAVLSIDSNVINLESQIKSFENNITTLNNNLSWLKENKNITKKQFDNQIISLNQNIANLNINLSPQNIFAWTNWTISNSFSSVNSNVWQWTPLCEIVADWENSLKIIISSANKLIDGFEFSVLQNNQLLFTWSDLSFLPSKDSLTQNYIYENILEKNYDLKVWDKLKVLIDYPDNQIENQNLDNDIIEVPIEYIIPRLNWYFVKIKDKDSKIIEKSIKIWEVDLPNIQILEWLELWDTLVK